MTRAPMNLCVLALALLAAPALSSIYYNNEFFTRMPSEETVKGWTNTVDPYSFIKDFSCEHLFSKTTKIGYLNFYKNVTVNIPYDWLNTETIKRPPTLVIVPPKNKTHEYLVDIKYADFTTIQDISRTYPQAECYIVPPYKPLMYVALHSPSSATNVYAIREGKGRKKSCRSFNKNILKKCQIVGPPISHDYPAHPFFLTATRKPDRNDITLFTLGSLDRLERLAYLAKVWDGPISMAIPITNSSKEIPIIFDTWLNTPELRRNADIHLLFDDKFKSMDYRATVFPINYLRSLALKHTRTELVMFVEGDHIFPNNFRSKMVERIPLFLKESRTMFLVFSVFGKQGLLPDKIPQSKAEIAKILSNETQDTFNTDIWGYELYNFTHWLKMDEIYNFTYSIKSQFEPYYVTHRNAQFYDETYVTWGFNKVTQIFDMNAVGYSMKVLPDVFMIHLNHSDIKGFKYWRTSYNFGGRHQLKIGTSTNRFQKLPGLLTNTYYPEWLRDKPDKFYCDYRSLEKLSSLKRDIKIAKSTVHMHKSLIIVLLCLLAGIIIVVFKNNSSQ